MLHVVASGNCIQWDFGQGRRVPCSGTVATPGLAKNVLTVGATESYNQQGYASGAFDACDSTNDLLRADNTGAIAPFSRISPDVPPQNYRYKPDLVAPGTRAYGRRSSRYQSSFVPPETIGSDFSCFLCNENLTGNAQYAWFRGTSFSTPAVSGAAAIVREWLRLTNSTLHFSDPFVWPSPALVKATLIAAARHLPESTAPLGAQGFGGLSLDTLFRAATNYYFFDQKFSLPNQGNGVWEKTLTVVPQRDVAIVLTWTDRFSVDGQGDLVNNLDLRVQAGSGLNMVYHGNNLTNGYSIQNPAYPVYDSVNTTEKVLIRADELANVGTITIHVSAFSLTGNALVTGDAITSPTGIHNGTQNEGTTLIPRQDFAIAVINAHE
jgi:subtilisin family serine protease